MNNDYFSDFIFTISILSSYIFDLTVELLSDSFKVNPDIKGIQINNTEYVFSQYATDSALTLAAGLCIDFFAHCAFMLRLSKTNVIS